MDLDIEPNLLDGGIAEGSYNFERQSSSRGHDERKLLFRKNTEDHLKDRFKFSKPLQDLEKCQDRCECRECHRTSKYYCGGNYDWLHFLLSAYVFTLDYRIVVRKVGDLIITYPK